MLSLWKPSFSIKDFSPLWTNCSRHESQYSFSCSGAIEHCWNNALEKGIPNPHGTLYPGVCSLLSFISRYYALLDSALGSYLGKHLTKESTPHPGSLNCCSFTVLTLTGTVPFSCKSKYATWKKVSFYQNRQTYSSC